MVQCSITILDSVFTNDLYSTREREPYAMAGIESGTAT